LTLNARDRPPPKPARAGCASRRKPAARDRVISLVLAIHAEDDGTPRLGEEERARLACELADAILADPQSGPPREVSGG
jgi:hypothetical protein